MKTPSILRNEHRTLAAVLHGLRYLVGEIRAGRAKPDFPLLSAMLYYIDTFPERFHHPKEDAYLFEALRRRCQAALPILDRLEADHRSGRVRILALARALNRYREGGEREFPAFDTLVEAYAAFEFEHMRVEETELLPLAREFLTPDDWAAIDAAFEDHDDPLFGAQRSDDFRELFRRIVNLAPPPIGVGPPAHGASGGPPMRAAR
jgi:hemerythrin-like domain-containing protein